MASSLDLYPRPSPLLARHPFPLSASLLALFVVLHPSAVEAREADEAVASSVLFWTALTTHIDVSEQLTCYTCVNVTDNDVCNRYAIDRPCPEDKLFCHSLHVLEGFGSTGDSLLVNKRCAGEDECNPKSVGCLRERGQTTCVSCCDDEYCNERSPVDAETAIFVQTRSSSGVATVPSRLPILLSYFWPFMSLVDSIRDFVAET